MSDEKIKTVYVRRGQPHIQPVGAAFSITTLAHDAVPGPWLDNWKANYQAQLLAIERDDLPLKPQRKELLLREYELEMEKLLAGQERQEHPFLRSEIAQAVIRRLWQYHGKYYYLCAYSLMSNHLHLLLDFSAQLPDEDDGSSPAGYVNVADVINRIKGGSAYDANRACGRTGSLWMKGYYDRYIRSHRHFLNAYYYILNNPVKAGIVKEWREHAYTFGDAKWLVGG